MTNNKKIYLIIAVFLILAGVGVLVFYFYRKSDVTQISNNLENDKSFIQTIAQSPAVEGNIINSGIAGKTVMISGKAFEASLEIFQNDNLSTPFMSVRAHSDGTFQVPLRPGSYILKPADPDGLTAPVKTSYDFTIGNGQWLQVKIEYK